MSLEKKWQKQTCSRVTLFSRLVKEAAQSLFVFARKVYLLLLPNSLLVRNNTSSRPFSSPYKRLIDNINNRQTSDWRTYFNNTE